MSVHTYYRIVSRLETRVLTVYMLTQIYSASPILSIVLYRIAMGR